MICLICRKAKLSSTSNSIVGVPHLFSGETPLAQVRVTVEIKINCETCGHTMVGAQTETIVCTITDATKPYPMHFYEFVRKSYGDGWNIRVSGNRLNSEQLDNPSMAQGWADAQARSESNGGRIPPKGFGHASSAEYLKSETACHHLKMLSLSELNT